MMFWLALIPIASFALLFAFCALALAGSADDDAVALRQLAERQSQQRIAEMDREGGGVVSGSHGEGL